jgi:alpha-glucosidase
VAAGAPWWRGAVVYQVYIRSFADGNGDGQGDFAGLRGKLGYLAGLGVDALWLSPIHPSPNRDWGYDVSDYEGIHPDYGTQDDFDALLHEAHALGLKVLTDEVLAHTSDEHAWFRDSLKGGDKADWYVWADPRLDGTVPNNWLSAFAGPAWAYQPARRQYYHHKFLRQQPKLNWRSDEARAAALAVLDHWLARGVDGFRLDVANAYLHDVALTDNPPVPMADRTAHNWAHAPNLQFHHHDSNLAENIEALDEIRRAVDRYSDRFVMGEFSEEPARCGCYAASDEGLHSGYSFPLLEARKLGPAFVRDHYAMLARHPRHWPSIAFSNHDVMRTVSRFGGKTPPPGLAPLMLALVLSLRGTALLYQGEELGLPQASIRRDQIRDPVGDLYYPYIYGRDGCRTPMPWDGDAPNLGFTTGAPWLPLAQTHKDLAVSRQLADSASTLNFTRRFLAARKTSAALRLGEIEFADTAEPLLAFTRTHGDERVLCVFNMGMQEAVFDDPRFAAATAMGIGCGEAALDRSRLVLGPCAAWFGHV